MSKPPFAVTDPRGFTVHLYDKRYEDHIQYQHPAATIDRILQTIESPEFITQDISFPTRENYYKSNLVDDDPDAFIKVCVETKASDRRVVTAYDIERKKGEKELWRP